MYALENIEKFVDDNAHLLGERGAKILQRATEASRDGIISGDTIDEIMGDTFLAEKFSEAAKTPEHMKIGTAKIAATTNMQS